ncbi:MAG: hypothetical protein ACRDUS_04205 [Mycobacterium sp.]
MSTTTIATIDMASSITRQRSDTDELVARSGENIAEPLARRVDRPPAVGLRIFNVAMDYGGVSRNT